MDYKYFDKKGSGETVKNKNISNKRPLDLAPRELAKELHKPIIRRFNKRKLHSSFTDNIWGGYLADVQLISRFNKGFRFLLCVIDLYCKYAWVISSKDKKCITITENFQNFLDESKVAKLSQRMQNKQNKSR